VTRSFTTPQGLRLSYRVLGDGPATLIGHPGGPGFSSRYLADLAGLGEHLRLILLDPRGTADSERPEDTTAYRTSDYVADLESLRAHLGLEQIDLLGHSHGGVVAQAYAAAHPARVRRLILASTLARFQEQQEAAMEAAMREREGEPWYADATAALGAEQAGEFETDEELGALVLREMPFYFARFGDAEREYLKFLDGERVNADALRLFNTEVFAAFDLRPEHTRIAAPTLVITGADDFITGPICAAELAAAIPRVTSVELPECGHFIHIEARDRFAGEVLRFLTDGA
jgi:proline iminopeptidase